MSGNIFKDFDKKLISGAIVVYFAGLTINTYKLAREVDPVKEEFHELVINSPDGGNKFDSLEYRLKVDDINDRLNKFSLDNGAYASEWKMSDAGYPINKAPLAIDPWSWFTPIDKSSLYK